MARTGNNARIPTLGTYGGGATFATDLTELADDVAELIDPTVATVAALPLTGNWTGRRFYVTAVAAFYMWTGSWKRQTPATGVAQFTTDGAGLGYINHGLGFTPSSVSFTQSRMDDTIGPVWKATIGALTATQIQVVSYRTDTNARLLTTIVSLHWVAYP